MLIKKTKKFNRISFKNKKEEEIKDKKSKSLIETQNIESHKKTELIILNEQILKGFEKCKYSKELGT